MTCKQPLALLMFVLFNILAFALPAQAEIQPSADSRYQCVNFGLFHPLCLFPDKTLHTNLNINLFYGHVEQVKGVDLSFGVTGVEKRLVGLQLAGLGAVAGGSGDGLQVGGLLAVAGDAFRGVQVSGLISASGKDQAGIQLAALVAASGERFAGVKLSGLIGVSGESCTGLQIAGLINVAGKTMMGLQVSGLLNVAGDQLLGAQVGTLNFSGQNRGLQIGLVNLCDLGKGVQIGLVNISNTGNTLPIGLVNVSRERGRIDWGLGSDSLIPLQVGVRFLFHHIYTRLSLGAYSYDHRGFGLSYQAIYGVQFDENWSVDAGYLHFDHSNLFDWSEEAGDSRHVQLKLNRVLVHRAGLEITLGMGWRYRVDRRATFSDSPWHLFAAVNLDFLGEK